MSQEIVKQQLDALEKATLTTFASSSKSNRHFRKKKRLATAELTKPGRMIVM
jgi:hypothetical protein